MKLKHSILLMIFICSVVPVFIWVAFSVHDTNKRIEKFAIDNIEAIGGSQTMSIRNFCDGRKESLETIAHIELIQKAILNHEPDKVNSELDQYLLDNRKNKTFVASLSLLDRNFHVIGSSESYTIDEISDFKDVNNKYHTGTFIIGNVYEREMNGLVRRLIPAYVGVYYNGNLIGYLVEEIDCTYFDRLRLNTDFLEDGTFYIIDGNGKLVTAGTGSEDDNRKEMISTLDERKNYKEAWDEFDHERYSEGSIQYEYKGDKYLTYFSEISYTDWGLRITENLSAQMATNSFYKLIVLQGVFFAIALIIMQFFIAKLLFYPFDRMVKALKKVQINQDYSVRTGVRKNNEVGEVARGIDELLGYIEKENLEEKRKQRELKELADSDPLTGIKNKRAIEHEMLNLIGRVVREDEQAVICFIDIDDFRHYNTEFGHQKGDEVIKFVAGIATNTFKGVFGRYGGDEFVMCYIGKVDESVLLEDIRLFMERVNTEFYDEERGCVMPIPCSIGIAIGHGENLDYVTMIKRADDAMYEAKNEGKNTYRIVRL